MYFEANEMTFFISKNKQNIILNIHDVDIHYWLGELLSSAFYHIALTRFNNTAMTAVAQKFQFNFLLKFNFLSK